MAQTQTITVNANHTAVERLLGFSVQEDSSAAAVVELREAVVGGTVVTYLNLAADETATIVFSKPVYLEFPGGCYVKEVSGSVSGVLYY